MRISHYAHQKQTCESSIAMATWNCRGMGTSEPYLKVLSRTADVILIQEHWLWPYELHKLSSYLSEFVALGKADHRLTEVSDLNRGCALEKIT